MKCDFEKDECGWKDNKLKDHIDWTRNSGGTPTPQTGPDRDHTLGTAAGELGQNCWVGEGGRCFTETVQADS